MEGIFNLLVVLAAFGLLLWLLKALIWRFVRFAKFAPNRYVFRYKREKIVAEGAGLSFFYFAPSTSLVAVPVSSEDAPFMLSETSADFQELTIQGQITYRVSKPAQAAQMLNYTINIEQPGLGYQSDDPQKLPERLVNLALVAIKSAVKNLSLKEAIVSSDDIAQKVHRALSGHEMVEALGLEILGLSIAAIRPTPETAKALEAETREDILRGSDQAVFQRRNYAVEQERVIRESELNTEIAVENKNREIQESKLETQRLAMKKEMEMQEERLAFQIQQEEKNQALIDLKTRNDKAVADAKAYALKSVITAYENTRPEVLKVLANAGLDSGRLLAQAFQGIADQAEKIGNLNITPDLLNALVETPARSQSS
ncbi:MAG: SPFH domain-containing protein [Azoarcus sp.]|nr:SPFH domain-containing protein [Azoarcus sp.]